MNYSRIKLSHVATLAVRRGLRLVFLYAGYVKLRQPWYVFAGVIDNYGVVQPGVSEALDKVLPSLELVTGVVLLAGWYRRTAGIAAASPLSGFLAMMLWGYVKGLKIDCGCFGPGEAVGSCTLLRAGVLVAGSFCVLIAPELPPQITQPALVFIAVDLAASVPNAKRLFGWILRTLSTAASADRPPDNQHE